MAIGAKLDESRRIDVRISADVLDRFDLIVDSIRSKVLESACRRAQYRKKQTLGDGVTETDILQSSCKVLRATALELDELLRKREPRHVRVRHAS